MKEKSIEITWVRWAEKVAIGRQQSFLVLAGIAFGTLAACRMCFVRQARSSRLGAERAFGDEPFTSGELAVHRSPRGGGR